MKSQKEAVFLTVSEVLGRVPLKGERVVLTKEQTEQVKSILLEEFKQGRVQLGCTYSEQDLKKYVAGLVANWLRKDVRLNGGVELKASASKAKQQEQRSEAAESTSLEDMSLSELVSVARQAVRTAYM